MLNIFFYKEYCFRLITGRCVVNVLIKCSTDETFFIQYLSHNLKYCYGKNIFTK